MVDIPSTPSAHVSLLYDRRCYLEMFYPYSILLWLRILGTIAALWVLRCEI